MSIYIDRRRQRAHASPDVMFRVVCGVGGERGWYSPAWLWEFRGLLDRMLGGPGMSRPRRDPDELAIGDVVGFWRVVNMDAPRSLHLIAEMKVPGVAALEFEVEPAESDDSGAPACYLTHSAKFEPSGFMGHAYWWSMVPAHKYVFGSMMAGMIDAAEREERKGATR
jgi:hypothetical protein